MYQPNYTITNKILKNIGSIEAAKEVIVDAPLLPLWEKQFKEDAIIRTAHHGTHVEGNQLNLDEAKQLLMGKEVVGRVRDVQEVINYRNTLELIGQQADKQITKITELLIKKVHRVVIEKMDLPDLPGEYRTKSVIIRDYKTLEIIFKPPSPLEIPFLMREFIYFLNRSLEEELHPILLAGIAHHEMVRIHPFIEGNGRVSRAIATLLMFLGGYDIRKFFSLEEYYDRDAVEYYKYLHEANQGNLTSWLEYFTLGVAIEFERIKKKILKLSKDTMLKQKLGGKQLYLTDRQTKIVEYIQSVGYIQNQIFRELFPEVSEDTILRDLKELIDGGLIKKVGKTKAARYIMV